MAQAYIVDAVRTAGGRRNGKLAEYHPNDLAAEVLNALIDRNQVDPRAIEDVILGCVTQGGEQSNALGRNAVLASKLPQSVPAVTIDRQCGSSQQAIQFAAQAVMSDTQDVVIACGVESMSRVPMFSNYRLYAQAKQGSGPWSQRVLDRFGVTQFSQFHGAQLIADKYGLTREDLDAFALASHRKASHATDARAFRSEIVPVNIGHDQTPLWHSRDEGIRSDATLSAIAAVKSLEAGGVITAANASQMCDGASAVLIVNERGLKSHGLTPLARIHALTVTAGDPVIMLEEPIASTQKALIRADLSILDIDLYEVNEAFASVPLAWIKAIGANPEKLNVNGGAIALGHPLGASGTKLMATLVHALKARGLRYGLQTMCEGGGIANTTIVERC